MKNLVKIPSQIAEAKKPGIGRGFFVTLKLGSDKGLPLLGLAWNVRVHGAANYWRWKLFHREECPARERDIIDTSEWTSAIDRYVIGQHFGL